MLILTSNGLSSPAAIEQATPYLANKTCALVTTASVGYKAQDRHVPRLAQELLSCGTSCVELFDFDEQTPAELAQYDAALLIGGNPFYLLDSIRKRGFADALRDLTQRGTLIGVSAGSLVLTPSIGIITRFTPEMNDDVGLTDLTALNLYPQEILPHYSKFLTRFERFEEKATLYERQHGVKLVRMNDGEVILCTFAQQSGR